MKPTMSKYTLLLTVLVVSLLTSGCNNVGNQPAGMSDQDAKSAIDKMTPEQKIKFIASSPMPEEEKKQKYAEIEKETGVSAASVLGNSQQAPGTNAASN